MGLNEPFFNHSSDVVFTAQEGGIAYLSCEVMIMMMIVMLVTMVTMMVMMVITAKEGRIAYLSCEVMIMMMIVMLLTMVTMMVMMAALPSCFVRCFFSEFETNDVTIILLLLGHLILPRCST